MVLNQVIILQENLKAKNRSIACISNSQSIERDGLYKSLVPVVFVQLVHQLLETKYTRDYEETQDSRPMTKALNSSRSMIRRIMIEDLVLYPYQRRKVLKLTEAKKKKRLNRSKVLLERFVGENFENLVFSDEKLFTIEEASNNRNDRIYAKFVEDICYTME